MTSQETRVPIKPGTARRFGLRRPVPDLVFDLTVDPSGWLLECIGAETIERRWLAGAISWTPPRRAETR